MNENKWYEIKIELKDIKPIIWRSFVVDSNILLPDFHKIIQTIMGWTNSHLHQFSKNDIIFSEPDEEGFIESINYKKIRLCEILKTEGDSIIYEYDFGDGWEHDIQLIKIKTDIESKYPLCIGGERCCPPEDCGGPPGYEDLLKVLKNPNKKEYKEMIEWIGYNFDSEKIDITGINKKLKKNDFGCIDLD
ncbi:MAG TPA: plasmid pRiA4b ORF-3 family protein [Dissulfurispiraceae bacterium]|nr:plasmid pRiA4b ORF-3 family protein [Dissulfurispiraceae bacterium]